MLEPSKALILHPLSTPTGEVKISQRPKDGYINATQLCHAAGKEYSGWRRQDRAQEYLDELSRSLQIHCDQLIDVKTKGPNHLRGTWVHPRIALRIAQWCSPKFEVQVDGWLESWLTNRGRGIGDLIRLFLYEDPTPWTKRVPDAFWKETERLYGIPYDPLRGAPQGAYPASVVHKLIKSRLSRLVQDTLDEVNPADENHRRKYKDHQFLKQDTAGLHYDSLVHHCINLMKESRTRAGFEQLWNILYPIQDKQLQLLPPSDYLGM